MHRVSIKTCSVFHIFILLNINYTDYGKNFQRLFRNGSRDGPRT